MKQQSETIMRAYNNVLMKMGNPPPYDIGDHFFDDKRECFNNINNKIKDIKELAPSVKAHPIGEFSNAHVLQTINTNAIASPSACDRQFANGSPEVNDVAALHAHDEDKFLKTNRDLDDDDAEETGDWAETDYGVEAAELNEMDEAAQYDPNFYYMRLDLFDNDDATRTSRFKCKIIARYEPDDDDKDKDIMVVEFRNRPRDIKTFLKGKGLWEHPWYQDVWHSLEYLREEKVDYRISPTIGIIKEWKRTDTGKAFEPVGFAICLLWQEQGSEPQIVVQYGSWFHQFELTDDFQARKKSNLFRVGRYRDETREKPKGSMIFKSNRRPR